MATTVASSRTIRGGGHVICRSRLNGMVYIVVENTSNHSIELKKGNAVYPTSFSTIQTLTPGGVHEYHAPSLCQSSSGALAITYVDYNPGAFPAVRNLIQNFVNTSDDSLEIIGTSRSMNINTSISLLYTDSLYDNLGTNHVVYSNASTLRGTTRQQVFYAHSGTGAGNEIVIGGSITTTRWGHIAWSRGESRPIVCYTVVSGSNPIAVARGQQAYPNTLNPFDTLNIGNGTALTNYNGAQIFTDAKGNEHCAYLGVYAAKTDRPVMYSHVLGGPWTSGGLTGWNFNHVFEDFQYDGNVAGFSRGYGRGQNDLNILAIKLTTMERFENHNTWQLVTGWRQSSVQSGFTGTRYVKPRWDGVWEPALPGYLDYAFEEGGDVYYDRISLNRNW